MLHCGDNYQHWVTTCFMEGQVLLYNSLGKVKATSTPELKRQIIEQYGMTACDGGDLNIAVPQVQKQSGKSDCGCFAIAWAVHLACGDKPETIILDQTQLLIWRHVYSSSSSHPFRTLSKRHSVHAHKHFLLTWTSFTLQICIYDIVFCSALF